MVEAMGVERALQKAEEADITLVVVDASAPEGGRSFFKHPEQAGGIGKIASGLASFNKMDEVQAAS